MRNWGACKNHAIIAICSWYVKIESNKRLMFDHQQNGKNRHRAHWEKYFTSFGNSVNTYGDISRWIYDRLIINISI